MQLNLQTGTRGNTIHFLFFGNERETLYTLYTLREAREILSRELRTTVYVQQVRQQWITDRRCYLFSRMRQIMQIHWLQLIIIYYHNYK